MALEIVADASPPTVDAPATETPTPEPRRLIAATPNFFGLVAVLLNTRMTLSRSMRRLADTTTSPGERELYSALLSEMESGSSFLEAAQLHRGSFSSRQLGWLAVADATGDMDLVLPLLWRFEFMNSALRLNLITAGLYLLVVVGLATLVLTSPLGVLLLMVAVGYGARRLWMAWDQTETQLRLARILMGVPGLGEVLRNWQVAQFSRALAVLLESGVPTAQAISLGARVVGTALAETASEQACAAFFEDRSLTSGLAEAGFLSPAYLSFVKCAEETGSTAQVVAWLADESEIELPRSTERLVRVCRKIGLGAVAAALVASLIVPMQAVAGVWAVGGPSHVLPHYYVPPVHEVPSEPVFKNYLMPKKAVTLLKKQAKVTKKTRPPKPQKKKHK